MLTSKNITEIMFNIPGNCFRIEICILDRIFKILKPFKLRTNDIKLLILLNLIKRVWAHLVGLFKVWKLNVNSQIKNGNNYQKYHKCWNRKHKEKLETQFIN